MRNVFFSIVMLAAVATALSAQEPAPSAANPQQETPPVAPSAPQAPQAPPLRPAPPLAVIDPAHGGADSGARGPGGVVESELVVEFARAIRVTLEGKGLRVILTREGKDDPSSDDRSAIINAHRSALFITLHASSTGPVGTARTYWYNFPSAAQTSPSTADSPAHRGLVQWDDAQRPYSDSSRRLAEAVQTQIAQKFAGSSKTPDAALVRQLRTVAAPAIAIEVSSVAVADGQQLVKMAGPLAEAVAQGVADFRAATPGDR